MFLSLFFYKGKIKKPTLSSIKKTTPILHPISHNRLAYQRLLQLLKIKLLLVIIAVTSVQPQATCRAVIYHFSASRQR